MTTYEHDDSPTGGGRVVRTFQRSAWSLEDRALLLAYTEWRDSRCPDCGQPKELAYHPDNEGEFEVVETYTCHSCTAIARADAEKGDKVRPRTFPVVAYTRNEQRKPLPPWPARR